MECQCRLRRTNNIGLLAKLNGEEVAQPGVRRAPKTSKDAHSPWKPKYTKARPGTIGGLTTSPHFDDQIKWCRKQKEGKPSGNPRNYSHFFHFSFCSNWQSSPRQGYPSKVMHSINTWLRIGPRPMTETRRLANDDSSRGKQWQWQGYPVEARGQRQGKLSM